MTGGGSGRKTGEKWIDLDAVVVGIKKGHLRFEIFVDPDLAFEYRRGSEIPLAEILKSYDIYEDARRGEHATDTLVEDAFGSSDVFDIAPEILKQGEFRLTHEQRNQLVEEKTDAIIENISKRAMNPQTGHPHPPDRIRQAMEEAKVRVDPFISVDEQVPTIVKALRVIIPISFESVKLQVMIPAAYSGKGYNLVAKAGVIKSESWGQDGSWTGVVELPAQKRQELYDELNKLTKGQIRIELVR
ncbi:ribosome assembly factor SBDS [Candidatus Thorarchaeota archaeon]|jgi:ribosome maturation protein SDO1|nr:MAG: ribosome assembly factor SBDS [Candidatus Thorarchaeota archaeon]